MAAGAADYQRKSIRRLLFECAPRKFGTNIHLRAARRIVPAHPSASIIPKALARQYAKEPSPCPGMTPLTKVDTLTQPDLTQETAEFIQLLALPATPPPKCFRQQTNLPVT